ncbi:MAG TPA: hypothetical protein VK563_12860 [Puia sp.]|nr:hypothetical protein [Puia sp.]
MEKIYKILVVFGLLMFAISYSIRARERKFRQYFFSKRIPLSFPGAPSDPALGLPAPEQSAATRSASASSPRPNGGSGPYLVSVLVSKEEIAEAEDLENQLFFTLGTADERQLAVSDRQTGDPVADLLLDERSDALIFDPTTRMIFSYSSEGALTIIRQSSRSSYKIMQRMLVPKEGQSLALDPQKGRIYLYTDGSVFVYANE